MTALIVGRVRVCGVDPTSVAIARAAIHLHALWLEASADKRMSAGCTQLAVEDIVNVGAGRVPFSCIYATGNLQTLRLLPPH